MDTPEQSVSPKPSSRHGRAIALGVTGVAWVGFTFVLGLVMNTRYAQWGDWLYSCWLGIAMVGMVGVLLFYLFPAARWRTLGRREGFVVDVEPAKQELFCIDCGYDLRSLMSERCPECGWVIDWSGMAQSHLAWPHREKLGRWRAFWRTTVTGTLRGKELAREVVRPVEDRDARRFATVVGALLALPLMVAACAAIVSEGSNVFNPMAWLNPRANRSPYVPSTPPGDLLMPLAAGLTLKPVVPLGLLLAAWLMARSGAIWFGRGSGAGDGTDQRRERAAALSRYAASPLAWMAIALLLVEMVSGAAALKGADEGSLGAAVIWVAMVAGGLFVVACLLRCWWSTVALMWRTTRPGEVRLAVAAVMLPVSWIFCLVIGLAVMPWVVGLVWVMIDSLRS